MGEVSQAGYLMFCVEGRRPTGGAVPAKQETHFARNDERLPWSNLAHVVQAYAGSVLERAWEDHGIHLPEPSIGSQAARVGLKLGNPKMKMALEPEGLI